MSKYAYNIGFNRGITAGQERAFFIGLLVELEVAPKEMAVVCDCHINTVYKWIKRYKQMRDLVHDCFGKEQI